MKTTLPWPPAPFMWADAFRSEQRDLSFFTEEYDNWYLALYVTPWLEAEDVRLLAIGVPHLPGYAPF